MEDLWEMTDIFTDTSTSTGIDSSIAQAVEDGQARIHTMRNFILGMVGIAILLFLISVVLKKMGKRKY